MRRWCLMVGPQRFRWPTSLSRSSSWIACGPIPPGATVPIDVVIQGDIDGGRADLSINNEMRMMLPSEGTIWSFKNGGEPGHDFKVPKPLPSPAIPLNQTGDPKRDPQS